MIIMVVGLPGSGKSFFASRLSKKLHAEYLKSDVLRKYQSHFNYSERGKEHVYALLLEEMRGALAKHQDVVLDATFYKKKIRGRFSSVAHVLQQMFILIEITADEETIRHRLSKPRPDSDADWLVYKKIKQHWEPINEEHLTLESTDDNVEHMLLRALQYIKQHHDHQPN